jgi:hypothetical protein
VFNLEPSFSPYKVAWKHVSSSFQVCVIEPVADKLLGNRIPIPDHGLMFIPVQDAMEAHYLAGILNSSIVRLVIQSYFIEMHILTDICKIINIPRYDPHNKLHLKLAELSKKAHQLAKSKSQEDQEDELKKVEEEIDNIVAQLYGITKDELKEVKKCLAMLQGEKFEEEVEETVELPPSMPDISLRNNVVGEDKPFNIDVVVFNPLDKPLTNVSVKLKLFDGRFIEKGFEGIEGEASFPLSFDGLKAGEYRIEAVFSYVFENTPKRVEKNLTIYVKGGEVKHVERSFKPEELFGV